jgi:NADP-dependent 3-hydroxy acid dehydrogenase YdfG
LRLTLISPANGARVVLCARRMERLQTIAAEDIDVNEIVVRPLATQV